MISYYDVPSERLSELNTFTEPVNLNSSLDTKLIYLYMNGSNSACNSSVAAVIEINPAIKSKSVIATSDITKENVIYDNLPFMNIPLSTTKKDSYVEPIQKILQELGIVSES